MGCGSSGQVVVPEEAAKENGGKTTNGVKVTTNGRHDDDLPTMVLPDTPIKAKPPIAFEIPLEEFSTNPRVSTPPPHVQRLMQPPQAEITLPDIEEKLAEAEQRRQAILQQRAASAQKRAQKVTRSSIDRDMDIFDSELETMDTSKHATNNLTIPAEPGVLEAKNIS